MTSTAAVLALIGDAGLRADADRVAAAAGVRVLATAAPSRKNWLAAAAVLVDEDSARRCAQDGMPRRDGVVLLIAVQPSATPWTTWSAAVAVGAQYVYALPSQEAELVRALSEAADAGSPRPGRLICTVPGRGGGGASVFAAALAQGAGAALLIDLDPCAAGIDLLLGVESEPGLRWPDLGAQGGRLNWAALQEALPRRERVTVLSSARSHHDIDAGLVASVTDAGRRAGATVVCDVPRHPGSAGVCALAAADLVAIVTSCDLRGVSGAAAVAGTVRTMNRTTALVLRGPSPGGLSPGQAAEAVGVPLLAAMRPEPMLARRLENGGLRLRRQSPLAVAARAVLTAAGVRGVPR